MEKRGVIAPGWTPPTTLPGEKQGTAEALTPHPTKQLMDQAAKFLAKPPKSGGPAAQGCER